MLLNRFFFKKILSKMTGFRVRIVDSFKYPIIRKFGYTKELSFCSLLSADRFDKVEVDSLSSEYILGAYENHHFDILGSGWVDFSNEMNGIIWNRDVISGYIWDENKIHYDATKAISIEEVDIKHPWELGRLQFLLQYAFLSINNGASSEQVFVFFQRIIEDFTNSNRCGYGVNWSCPMDVAIRATNIIICFDFISSFSKRSIGSDIFIEELKNLIFLHGDFIYSHLERNRVYPERSNNHYLSNISGLIFISSWLLKTGDRSVLNWHEFSKRELLSCFDNQFNFDGSNFESSLSYHRLSSELLMYPVAVLMGLYDVDWVKEWLGNQRISKIGKLVNITIAGTMPNGDIVQIGDNDSGRFICIDPVGELYSLSNAKKRFINLKDVKSSYLNCHWEQNVNSHNTLVDIHNVLVCGGEPTSCEGTLVRMLTKGRTLGLSRIETAQCFSAFNDLCKTRSLAYQKFDVSDIKLKIETHSCFGLTSIYDTENTFKLVIYHGDVGQSGQGGHAHADYGAYAVYHKGTLTNQFFGTYTYTRDIVMRDKFRVDFGRSFAKEAYSFPTAFSSSFDYKKCSIKVMPNFFEVKFSDKVRTIAYSKGSLFVLDNFQSQNLESPTLYSSGYGRLEVLR
ncbi:hypothetical protein [Vibrio owensii]|uniref:Heparin-sulfate lyase N-terminal domain-containing protein n=1 Tax=Vibrio owensii CAIM 1854 = LMG 25443 TaxID=1229493 RepID=A0A0C1VKW7_9VIBR|nr:hypothetical protein [Vibrio owensii]KIF50398.1 hypothetical protein H735_24950 [Vibrio owensii CAIM 1854 = LMG 25443]